MPTGLYGAPPTNDPSKAFSQAWQTQRNTLGQGADYWGRISNYDPMASVQQYGQAAGAQANTYLTQELDKLRGSAVGAGRLDTGFYDSDQGDLVKSVHQDLNEKLAMQGVNAAGLQLQQYGQMGNWAGQQQQQYYDLLTGQLDRDTSERNAKRAASAAKWQAVGSAVGGIASHLPI